MYYTLQLSSLKYCIQLHASSNKLLYGLIILLTQKVRLSPALLCSLVPWVPHFFALVVTAVSPALPSSHISFSLHVSLCRPTPALLHPKTRNLSTHNSSAKCKHTCDYRSSFRTLETSKHIHSCAKKPAYSKPAYSKAKLCEKSAKQRDHYATVDENELLKLRIFHLAVMLDENLEFEQLNTITSQYTQTLHSIATTVAHGA